MSMTVVPAGVDTGLRTNPVRIVLVDDNPTFLQVASNFLAGHDGLAIAGVAGSGTEALEAVRELRPDLAVVDLSMPGMGGPEATRLIKALPAPPRLIMLSLCGCAECRLVARTAGADGFVGKAEFGTALVPLITELFPESHRLARTRAVHV